ncbi:MAG: FAD-dependent oxidoreductase [Acidobacteriota bacterium]
MSKESSVLVYGTSLGGYRAAYAFCKKGHKVIYLNRGSYVDEIKNQTLSQLPLDFCWMCGHFPQRLFKSLGSFQDYYNAELLELSGTAGNYKVKFKAKPQIVNNFICTECDKCIDVCSVKVNDRKAIYVHPEIGWENIYIIDWENCTKCKKCEEICPTGALKIERPEEIKEEKVGAIVLALEYEEPGEEDLARFGFKKFPCVVKNSDIARNSLLTNFIKDSIRLPSGELPESFAVVVTPHFNNKEIEYESYNLSVSAAYRAVKLKTLLPESYVTIFLKDYRGFGKRHYKWYQKALKAGVQIERAESLNVSAANGNGVTIHYEKENKNYEKSVGLAILITGQKPPQLMDNISQIFGVKADERGFCRLKPFSSVETDVDGIFAAGEFSGPKGNPEAIWEGCVTLTESMKYLGAPNFKPAPPPALRNISEEERKIGVFICSCFGTFNEKMDLEGLKKALETVPDISHVEIIKGCCTPPTIDETAEIIKNSGVNHVVLAVCTPIQKLAKFRQTVMKAGLNPLLSEFVRLREDVINVHQDKEKMLEKAVSLIKTGVTKVKKGVPASTLMDNFTGKALVIGAGISGLTCAAEIAENGFPVILIEKEDKLGGRKQYLYNKQKEYLNNLISKVENNQHIEIYKKAQLKERSGYAGNFSGLIIQEGKEHPVEAGVIILATGAKEYTPQGFLYGQDPRVITQTELKEKFDGKRTGIHAVMIQCVGSRNNEHPYCSRVCCNQALKNALFLKEKGAEVTILFRDITSYGKENYYQKAKESGVKFIRFEENHYPEVQKNG